MDITALSLIFFVLLKGALWISLIYFGYTVYQRVNRRLEPTAPKGNEEGSAATPPTPTLTEALVAERLYVGLSVIALFALIFFTQSEMAFRPKTVIQPDNPELELQLRELDRMSPPVIMPAEGDLRDKAAYDGYSERNEKENKAAEDRFLELP